jgi:NADPH-dependent curcumin reductase CurA
MISQYNVPPAEQYPIRNLALIIGKKLKLEGFIVGEKLGPIYADRHRAAVEKWIQNGEFKPKNHYTDGIDNSAEGLIGIFEGKNFGKAILRLPDLEGYSTESS